MGDEPKPKRNILPRKRIPEESLVDVAALLRRTLLLVGALALKKKQRVFPFEVAMWEAKLAELLEELNDMQITDCSREIDE